MPGKRKRKSKKIKQSRGNTWGDLIIKIRRKFTKPVNKKEKKKSKAHNSIVLWGRVIVALIIVLAIFSIFTVPIIKYFTLKTNFSDLDWRKSRSLVIGDKMNILVTAYKEGDNYSFIDFLGLLRLDFKQNRANIVIINPDLATYFEGEPTELRKILAKSESINEDPLQTLTTKVEGVLGMQVDRYALINTLELTNLIQMLGINYEAEHAVKDPDVESISVGDYLDSDQIIDYLGADKPGIDAKSNRLEDFSANIFSNYTDLITTLRALWSIDKFFATIETNMNKNEILDVINMMWRAEEIGTEYIAVFDTLLFKSSGNKYYVPSNRLVDEKLRQLFAVPEVVKEQARIEIYNAAGKTGLANRHSRWLENLGANVVRAGNYPEILDQTLLYNPYDGYFENVELVRWLTRGKVEVVNEVYPYNHTGELVLVLGTNVVKD